MRTARRFLARPALGRDPGASALRPESYTALPVAGALTRARLGVPRMYIGRDTQADEPIATRPSVLALWENAARHCEALGAEIDRGRFPGRLEL